jgi:hypothetical protein
VEDAVWSARRDTDTGYGIAVFDLDPGSPGGKTSITISYYHALGADRAATSNYEVFEEVVQGAARVRTPGLNFSSARSKSPAGDASRPIIS